MENQKQIEAINEEIEKHKEEKEAIEEQMKAVEEYYDKLIKETEEMFDEMIDRYGDMPDCVHNLLVISLIKSLANKSGADVIEYTKGNLSLKLREDAQIDLDKLQAYLAAHKADVKLLSGLGQTKLSLRVEDSPRDDVLLKNILSRMKEIAALRIQEEGQEENDE